jgi:hypothetical protein
MPYKKNGYSVGNFQLRNKESTRGMGFHGKLPDHKTKNASEDVIPPVIANLWTLIQIVKNKMCKKPPNSNYFKISNTKSDTGTLQMLTFFSKIEVQKHLKTEK